MYPKLALWPSISTYTRRRRYSCILLLSRSGSARRRLRVSTSLAMMASSSTFALHSPARSKGRARDTRASQRRWRGGCATVAGAVRTRRTDGFDELREFQALLDAVPLRHLAQVQPDAGAQPAGRHGARERGGMCSPRVTSSKAAVGRPSGASAAQSGCAQETAKMKFGKRMLREQHEPWTDAYVNYKVCLAGVTAARLGDAFASSTRPGLSRRLSSCCWGCRHSLRPRGLARGAVCSSARAVGSLGNGGRLRASA